MEAKRAQRGGVGIPPGLLYALGMLTKVAIILLCLVVLFGFGRKPKTGSSRRTTNILLALVAFLLVLTLITNLAR